MSYVCKRGYKCMCFQCGEKDCDHFESKPPKWDKEVEKMMNKRTEEHTETHASDLISRRAAIDEVNSWLKDRMTDAKNGKPLTDRLKDLPSAQPDTDEVVSQIKWERDMAVQQLKDLGYSLGEKPRMEEW